MEKINIIIDFDSTMIKIEAIEKLASICLADMPNSEDIQKQINRITDLGMEGKITFAESLKTRLKMFKVNKNGLFKLNQLLKKEITESFLRNKKFFQKYKKQIYIVSGGFMEYIWPIAKRFYINKNHILANNFIFDKRGVVKGFESDYPLLLESGKALTVLRLKLKGKILVIGDGYTDYEIKEYGAAHKFFAFCENIRRKKVVEKADFIVNSFEDVIYILKKLDTEFF